MSLLLSGIVLLIAYLLGSLSGSLLMGRLRGVDVRKLGSGNAGGTNALRTQGWSFALPAVVVDISKGCIAVAIAQLLADAVDHPQVLAMAAGAAAVLGHVWPIFFGFRGGKGAATVVGVLLVLWPFVLLPLIAVWLLVMLCTGYVGLATMLAALSLIPCVWWWGAPTPALAWQYASLVVPAFMIYTHRDNLRRLRAGSENRFERIRIIGRRLDRFR
jgi:acyl phosphate:glycerol-3-phosphate acyltransferase